MEFVRHPRDNLLMMAGTELDQMHVETVSVEAGVTEDGRYALRIVSLKLNKEEALALLDGAYLRVAVVGATFNPIRLFVEETTPVRS